MQNSGAGRAMMQHMLERVAANRLPGVRLVQTAYHNRSFSLYAKLGFEIREPLSVMIGPPIESQSPATRSAPPPTLTSTRATGSARRAWARSRRRIARRDHGERPTVVEHLGRITGYATAIGYAGHAVGESNDELKALISAATDFAAAARWCRRATANCSDGATARGCA